MTALEEIKKALAAAEQFIVNGVELGYIRMPAPETPDSAHDTLPMIRQAQTALESLQRENAILQERTADYPAISAKLHDREKARDAEQKSCREAIARAEAAESEVKRLQSGIDPALIGIAEEMKESGGHWQPCTGCYDTLEGYPTQNYDDSPALQTAIGCGCHECGGLGAVWWHMTDQDIADFEKICEEVDTEHDLTVRISRLEYVLRTLCKAYAACNGEDHPAYIEARAALASTGGEHHAE